MTSGIRLLQRMAFKWINKENHSQTMRTGVMVLDNRNTALIVSWSGRMWEQHPVTVWSLKSETAKRLPMAGEERQEAEMEKFQRMMKRVKS